MGSGPLDLVLVSWCRAGRDLCRRPAAAGPSLMRSDPVSTWSESETYKIHATPRDIRDQADRGVPAGSTRTRDWITWVPTAIDRGSRSRSWRSRHRCRPRSIPTWPGSIIQKLRIDRDLDIDRDRICRFCSVSPPRRGASERSERAGKRSAPQGASAASDHRERSERGRAAAGRPQ